MVRKGDLKGIEIYCSCGNKFYARQSLIGKKRFCSPACYQNYFRTNSKTPEERFEAAYIPEPNSGCWLWLGCLDGKNYGILGIDRRNVYAHRFSYVQKFGAIPAGKELDHKCRNTYCCNPDHVEPVTHRENMLRSPLTLGGRHIRRTHCPHGHEYSEDNTYIGPLGHRFCKICRRAFDKKRGHERGVRVS
jgi:HNH endonuclease